MDAHECPRLILEVDDARAELSQAHTAERPMLSLGKDPDNDFVWGSAHASRHHARIEIHRNDFYLVDASTNGTFVQTEDENVQYVHRDRVRLWGDGWIALGEPLHAGRPIYFHEAW